MKKRLHTDAKVTSYNILILRKVLRTVKKSRFIYADDFVNMKTISHYKIPKYFIVHLIFSPHNNRMLARSLVLKWILMLERNKGCYPIIGGISRVPKKKQFRADILIGQFIWFYEKKLW